MRQPKLTINVDASQSKATLIKTRRAFFYRGWMLLAPIWFRPQDNTVKPRFPWLGWWLDFNSALSGCFIAVYSFIYPDWEPVFYFKITDPDWTEELDAA